MGQSISKAFIGESKLTWMIMLSKWSNGERKEGEKAERDGGREGRRRALSHRAVEEEAIWCPGPISPKKQ